MIFFCFRQYSILSQHASSEKQTVLVLHENVCVRKNLFLLCATVSTFARGDHMIPVLNRLEVHVAVYGNHDFGE